MSRGKGARTPNGYPRPEQDVPAEVETTSADPLAEARAAVQRHEEQQDLKWVRYVLHPVERVEIFEGRKPVLRTLYPDHDVVLRYGSAVPGCMHNERRIDGHLLRLTEEQIEADRKRCRQGVVREGGSRDPKGERCGHHFNVWWPERIEATGFFDGDKPLADYVTIQVLSGPNDPQIYMPAETLETVSGKKPDLIGA